MPFPPCVPPHFTLRLLKVLFATQGTCTSLDCLCTSTIANALKSCLQCAVDANIAGYSQSTLDDAINGKSTCLHFKFFLLASRDISSFRFHASLHFSWPPRLWCHIWEWVRKWVGKRFLRHRCRERLRYGYWCCHYQRERCYRSDNHQHYGRGIRCRGWLCYPRLRSRLLWVGVLYTHMVKLLISTTSIIRRSSYSFYGGDFFKRIETHRGDRDCKIPRGKHFFLRQFQKVWPSFLRWLRGTDPIWENGC